ncbi:MAG: transcription termination factor Rho [Acidimicrobiales bacterium]|nr:transcription termination factor Rho [Acidimicrobiales bacterium]
MSDATPGRADLQKKDRSELQTIITALGGKPSSRAKKDDLINMVLELTGADANGGAASGPSETNPSPAEDENSSEEASGQAAGSASESESDGNEARGKAQGSGGRQQRPAQKSDDGTGEDPNRAEPQKDDGNVKTESNDDEDQGNRRRRRRGRGRDRDEENVQVEPQAIGGNLDLRDEGYGFLRVDGALPSPEDVYVPLKTVRVHGLRKGDYVAGTARPASRNERNAALHSLELINDKDPKLAVNRPRFEKQTPVFPTEALPLEREGSNTGRLLDLLVPLGKGQRSLIVAPPETGASTLLCEIAESIEANHADMRLIVMLLDERPEEITALTRRLEAGEVIASGFDRPPEEQVAVAEMAVERAKRMVEEGEDVIMLVDGLTPLMRAYNLTASAGGRLLAGGVDASAIYPCKRFFGAARALEEGGSLTMVATVRSETGSPVDDLILDEFRGTATSEIHLSRHLADRGVSPAIDPDRSFTRARDHLFDADEAALVDSFLGSVRKDDTVDTMKSLLDRLEATPSTAALLGAS